MFLQNGIWMLWALRYFSFVFLCWSFSLQDWLCCSYKTLKTKFADKYYIVYNCSNNKTKTYLIGDIDLYNSFGNNNENRDNAGFKAYCFARKQVRSFRHDRIVSLTKKWVLNFLLEISLLACIICLLYTTYLLKQKSFN